MGKQRVFHHIKYSDRLELELLFKAGYSVPEAAAKLGFSKTAIYNELKRAGFMFTKDYSADFAQKF